MTDKQIIIDGRDVSGCEYCGYGNVCRLSDYIVDCEDNPNCYYKQLKRAEQRIVELNKTIQAKEQECEELKDKLNCCFCNPYIELNDIEKQRKCVEVTECFRRQLDQLKAENERLKQFENDANDILKKQLDLFDKKEQALKEIKEIAQYDVYTPHTDLCLKLNWVKKKISEVEDERI